jgi:arginase
MPLAIATGRGPELLTDLEHRKPYLAEEDAVVLGCRDLSDVVGRTRKHVRGSEIAVHDLDDVRRRGPGHVAAEVLDQLIATGVNEIWVHLDVDVLDEVIMPAVDSPEPGGMSPAE